MTEETQYPELKGQYFIHEEVGSGGFGKVKLATHLLSGQKVAIKIIDKKAVGSDLPRVKTELDALKTLSHQNICRLYQWMENNEKFFIIMEYCAGGEMFDYIVRKERLEESEARHFFRQLVQAMAYVHSKGYAHRDLKPENLLLTQDLHLKVIDFGLCAKPGVLSNPLETCCGSPAYAAPELISGQNYRGDRADVWSMGVLLYALVCGALPFEDENTSVLFEKIRKGNFHKPSYLSQELIDLLRGMMRVNPDERMTINQVIEHKWLNYHYSHRIKWNSIFEDNIVDTDIARELAYHFGVSLDRMTTAILSALRESRFTYTIATYYILLNLKQKGQRYNLQAPATTKNGAPNLISSPTIHASLENNLDRIDTEFENWSLSSGESDSSREREVRFARPLSPDRDKKTSYVNAVENMPLMGRPGFYDTPPDVTPRSGRTEKKTSGEIIGKENRSATVRVRGPVRILDTDMDGSGTIRPKSIYSTPQRPPLKALFSPGAQGRRAQSSDRGASGSPASIGSGSSGFDSLTRTPRSTTKTPRFKQRIFSSLERKKEQVISLLTPRKLRNDSPQVLRTAKGMVNVSMTNSRDADRVKAELIKVFEEQGINYELNGWKINGKKKQNNHEMTVELEVVMVESLGQIGIKRKRLAGDAFLYKRVCEQILKMADLGMA